MNYFPTNNPCPCESGLDFNFCCGAPNRSGLNIVANVDHQGNSDRPLPPPIQSALENLGQSPDFFPVQIKLHENSVTLVKMSPFWFNESVFLDASRIMGSYALKTNLQWVKNIADSIALLPTPIIFHTAFCGSTLMSRAIEVIYETLPLREPDALGTLLNYSRSPNSDPRFEKEWYQRILSLLSRRFDADQTTVVKSNDYANPIISKVLEFAHDVPILFMYTPLNEFLSGCLKVENRRQWIIDRYHYIKPHLSKVLELPNDLSVEEKDYGKMAALYWCFNIAHFLKAQQQHSGKIKSLDFNIMLDKPKECIEACGQWFNLTLPEGKDIQYEINWLFGVYSKNPEFAYSAQTRRNEIDKTLQNNPAHLQAAESLAHELLGDNYPESHLPNALV